jgi:hypothetical protein
MTFSYSDGVAAVSWFVNHQPSRLGMTPSDDALHERQRSRISICDMIEHFAVGHIPDIRNGCESLDH